MAPKRKLLEQKAIAGWIVAEAKGFLLQVLQRNEVAIPSTEGVLSVVGVKREVRRLFEEEQIDDEPHFHEVVGFSGGSGSKPNPQQSKLKINGTEDYDILERKPNIDGAGAIASQERFPEAECGRGGSILAG
ncbi:hypothetical protein FH972_027211 [Carpinus fangiana]|uniref:Uncharacterized protein n=1 Tax=Carpinus fangiana TaxID=176857 RepID=A0A5N6L6B6_9ROSI|nr:hypothetical protein FH972_027211 [Carpinus fangiana]